jgi:hypothetical protein
MTPPVARQMPLTGPGRRGPREALTTPACSPVYAPPGPTRLSLARMHVHPHRILHFHTHTHLHGPFGLGSARPDPLPRRLLQQITAPRATGSQRSLGMPPLPHINAGMHHDHASSMITLDNHPTPVCNQSDVRHTPARALARAGVPGDGGPGAWEAGDPHAKGQPPCEGSAPSCQRRETLALGRLSGRRRDPGAAGLRPRRAVRRLEQPGGARVTRRAASVA